MNYSLSTNVILDSLHARAAFAAFVTNEGEEIDTTVLDPCNRGLLRLMIKNAFADIVVRLLPLATECNLDGEDALTDPGHQERDDGSDVILSVEIDHNGLTSAVGAATRRHLENAVAMLTLSYLAASQGNQALAGAFESLSNAALASFSSAGVRARPFVRGCFSDIA